MYVGVLRSIQIGQNQAQSEEKHTSKLTTTICMHSDEQTDLHEDCCKDADYLLLSSPVLCSFAAQNHFVMEKDCRQKSFSGP